MLDILPTEVTLSVLSHLPIPLLLPLLLLSRQWFDLFTANQSVIFHSAALLHEYIQPGTLFLEDALAVNTGRPWAGSTSWKDFCRSHPHRYGGREPCHFTLPLTNLVVKATGRFSFAKTGRERGAQSHVCCRLRVPGSIVSRLTKRPGYASQPTSGEVSP
jgi:hypothetical protein